ncbi:DUF6098 family protein [Streptomyces sp. NPDC127038]|uniref:DUF6098 family protein n=1 Tax=Streptomyces sp. NPDC127038 TaxID=3347114 RepID=UPI00364C79CA
MRSWLLRLGERTRPDNEPLVDHVVPLAWIAPGDHREAVAEVADQPGPWGPVERGSYPQHHRW